MRVRIAVFIGLALNYVWFFIDGGSVWSIIAKALPVSWLLLWAIQRGRSQPQLAIALLFGIGGDVFMALDLFIVGLASFLVGHIAYIALWLSAVKSRASAWSLVPIAVLMLVACIFILPASGPLMIAVALYFLVIAAMAALATRTSCLNAWGLLGVYSFLVSDFIIGWNRFVEPLAWSAPAIMLTYFAAQGLIASSVIAQQRRAQAAA